jgi:hypothetical protein
MQEFPRDNGERIGMLERQMNEHAEPDGGFVRIVSGMFMPRALQPCSARAPVCMKPQDGQCMLLPIDEIPIPNRQISKRKGNDFDEDLRSCLNVPFLACNRCRSAG